ncbi:sugar phosphate isomerase/epimerase [Pseudomonas fluorescens]|uniref:sugar phosphate isomerase/epimerase family protein n=1 Tax=Pseudomonas fluorescens TaxID=294 RepID=UPI00190495E4|nr:sugar phosphate isomerase/epimerase family protein [Pseudomonas fluorescens]MBD8094595.1 sugar phosphate isomerase/epimerase [Pseudomonas fluorescens]MBD8720494.1 sugar phosphate isomerase/epimerase [Pseudomonas fluorescens]
MTATNKTFLNFIMMGGSTEQKIAATRAAGFDEAEIWKEDVQAWPGSPDELKIRLAQAGLSLADIMVLRDFAGAPPYLHDEKRAQATQMLDMAVSIGTNTVQSPATTLVDCDPDKVDEDLRWLARQAAARGLRISYEAMAWSVLDHNLPAAWERIQRVGEPNIGIVVDLFHCCTRNRGAEDLDGIPVERIFQLQLSDLIETVSTDNLEHLIDTARHRRVLPGTGRFDIAPFIKRLRRDGYSGPVGVEVFSDELKAQPAELTARMAMASLRQIWRD